MPEADFTVASEVHFGNLRIDEVFLGTVKLWPVAKAPVNGKIDLAVPTFITKLNEASNTFNVAAPFQFTLPHDTDHVHIETPTGLVAPAGVEDMGFAALADSNRFYGSNQSQDPASQGEDYPPDGRAMQTRYGGDWILPPGGKAGDKIYINVGSFSGFFALAVITLT